MGGKVFVADDDPILLRGLRLALGSRGYEVRTAASGAALLTLLRGDCPDLVIVDVMMPGMTGLDVLREVRRADCVPRVPVVIITALADPGVSRVAWRRGAADVIAKPFRLDELVARLEACLSMGSGGGPGGGWGWAGRANEEQAPDDG